MTDAKVFLNGFIPKALGEKDPEFVMGKGSIKIDDMIQSLQDAKQYADNSWINYQIFSSKKDPSKRYAQLNLWKPQKQDDYPYNTSGPEDLITEKYAQPAHEPWPNDEPPF